MPRERERVKTLREEYLVEYTHSTRKKKQNRFSIFERRIRAIKDNLVSVFVFHPNEVAKFH